MIQEWITRNINKWQPFMFINKVIDYLFMLITCHARHVMYMWCSVFKLFFIMHIFIYFCSSYAAAFHGILFVSIIARPRGTKLPPALPISAPARHHAFSPRARASRPQRHRHTMPAMRSARRPASRPNPIGIDYFYINTE